MDIFNNKTRRMHGYTIHLIIYGLLIAENGVVLATLTPTEGLIVDLLPYPFGKPYNLISQYFNNEKDVVFENLEIIYGIGEQSSNPRPFKPVSGRDHKKRQKENLFLAYGTLLAFWTAVDFKICTLIFSIFEDYDKEEHEILKQKCDSYFKEMYFTFLQFRGRLEGKQPVMQAEKERGERPIQGDGETEAVHKLLLLTSDFIVDMDTFDKQTADKQWSQFINWWKNPTKIEDGNTIERPTSSSSYLYMSYRARKRTMEEMYNTLQRIVEKRMLSELQKEVLPVLTKLVIPGSNYNGPCFWSIFRDIKYSTKLRMWNMLDGFTVDSQANKKHRISNAIEIMKEVRITHYTVLFMNYKYLQDTLLNRT